ncbi:hypothetical protein B296_00025278 [Ensete ventricosum]|uniref:Uncharacterized protein n=1 Tax=Ensete ventricosum TaxID=4639 RepID=A0A426ZDE1_ENSVE|nr:hypothetical protein B296_00025278 [Ensete ventricosum]
MEEKAASIESKVTTSAYAREKREQRNPRILRIPRTNTSDAVFSGSLVLISHRRDAWPLAGRSFLAKDEPRGSQSTVRRTPTALIAAVDCGTTSDVDAVPTWLLAGQPNPSTRITPPEKSMV